MHVNGMDLISAPRAHVLTCVMDIVGFVGNDASVLRIEYTLYVMTR